MGNDGLLKHALCYETKEYRDTGRLFRNDYEVGTGFSLMRWEQKKEIPLSLILNLVFSLTKQFCLTVTF
jgi:hypothetical protein